MAQMDGTRGRVGEYELTVYKLDPLVSAKLLRKLMAVLVPSATALAGKAGSFRGLMEMQLDLAAAGRELFDRLDDALLEELIRTFGEKTHGPGGLLKDTYRGLFLGKVELLFEWLWFAIKSEYEGVLGKVKGGIDLDGLWTKLRRSASDPSSQTAGSSTASSSGT